MAQLYGRPCLPEGAQVASDEARVAFHEVGDDRGGCSEPVKRGRNYCDGTVSYVKAVRRGQNGGLPGSLAYIPVRVQPGCDLDAGLDRLAGWRWVTVIFVSGSPQ